MNKFKTDNIEVERLSGCTNRIKNQKGVTIILVALLLVVLIGFVALAVDVGYYMVTRNELQNIADGAALAACSELGEIYRGMTPDAQKNYFLLEKDIEDIREKAVSIGESNQAGGLPEIIIELNDVIIGTWDGNSLTPILVQPDAVRVIARRQEDYANGPISTFFARIMGINTVNVWMDATAALTGQSTSGPGELELPVGISSYFFQDGVFCNDYIVFNPTNDPSSCAGWNSWDISPPNDNLLRQILDESVDSPGTTADETVFEFIGGNLSNPTFDELLLLFMRKGYDTDSLGDQIVDDVGNPIFAECWECDGTVPYLEEGQPAYYPDDKENPTPRNEHRWETSVVVYDRDDCSNPNTAIKIVGYAKISITNVQNAPEKRIEGKVLCNYFSNEPTRGGGGNFGLKGTIPGLVE
jgi:hypothetical protein